MQFDLQIGTRFIYPEIKDASLTVIILRLEKKIRWFAASLAYQLIQNAFHCQIIQRSNKFLRHSCMHSCDFCCWPYQLYSVFFFRVLFLLHCYRIYKQFGDDEVDILLLELIALFSDVSDVSYNL